MSVPYFGHGQLDWKVDQGLLIAQYILPWEHDRHNPHIKGSATFTENGQPVEVSYEIVYLKAAKPVSRKLTSHDGQLSATIQLTGGQQNDYYVALVQGYPPPVTTPSPGIPPFSIDYHITAIRIPKEDEISAATNETEWKFDGKAPLPPQVKNELVIALESSSDAQIYQWDQAGTGSWQTAPADEIGHLKRLGAFAVATAASTVPVWSASQK